MTYVLIITGLIFLPIAIGVVGMIVNVSIGFYLEAFEFFKGLFR